jgi:hypothetical protein
METSEQTATVQQEQQTMPVQSTPQGSNEPIEVKVPVELAIKLRLQEFDKNIDAHKAEAAKLEAEKSAFIYKVNTEQIVNKYKEK